MSSIGKIRAPFNFVPLSEQVFFPEWADKVSQDIPFSDGEDGIISLEISTKSPLFIRNGHKKNEEDNFSSHVLDDKGNRHYFIPGSSLKGCFRNVMEILSFSKMQRYNNDSFGYRSFTTQIKGLPKYMDTMKGVGCGWMYLKDDICYVQICNKGVQKIRHEDIKKRFRSFNSGQDGQTAQVKQESLGEELYPLLEVTNGELSYCENKARKNVPAGDYRVVCTGYMKGKKIEYLFSEDQSKPVEVDHSTFVQFETMHKFTPYYGGQNGKDGFLKKRLREGKSIPVFFQILNNRITSIGITRMFKFPYKYSIKDIVFNTYDTDIKELINQESYDLTECIFGEIGGNSLKGRVCIGNAFTNTIINDNDLRLVSGVLAQPRPSYYPLYLQQDGRSVVNYSTNNVRIAGRKRYRISKEFQLLPLGQGNGNENLLTHFRPIPEGLKFECKMSVHNLKKVEIGALLSSITFNQTGGCYHNIGQAKAFGYGVIECKIKSLSGLKYKQEEYIDEFDSMMSFFLQEKCNTTLQSNESLKSLVSISSPNHTIEEMMQMDFEKCEAFKEDGNASILVEESKRLNVSISESKLVIEYSKKEITERIQQILSLNDINRILDELQNVKLRAIRFNLDLNEIETLISQYSQKKKDEEDLEQIKNQQRIDEEKKREREQQEQEIEQRRKDRINAGLSFLLEKKFNSEELKISDISNGSKRIKQFKDKNKDYVFTEFDISTIKEWLQQLPSPTKKSDKKEYDNFDSSSWKLIAQFVGEDLAQNWHSIIIK